MNAEHIDPRPGADRDAVVTYRRVPARRQAARPVVHAPNEEIAPKPTLDAAEIYPDEPEIYPDEPIFGFAGDPLRGRGDAIEDFIEDAGRPNWFRYSLVGASLALFAGVGILAATVGVATMLPRGPAQDDASGAPAVALNAPDAAAEAAANPDGIREIPMPSGAPEVAWDSEIAPPIPRPRPEEVLARVEPEPAVTQELPAASAEPARAAVPLPAAPEAASVPPPAPAPDAPQVAAAPAGGGADGLISSIEETLARIDADTSAEAAPLLPQEQPPAAASPMTMTQPVYPPPADILPPSADILPPPADILPPPADILPPPVAGGIDPTYDVAPPPATVDGHQGYSTGPVPPEPVPDVYPQAPYLNPATPGVYPSDSYGFPSETVEETENERPGFLRRTLTKATDTVGRIFARN